MKEDDEESSPMTRVMTLSIMNLNEGFKNILIPRELLGTKILKFNRNLSYRDQDSGPSLSGEQWGTGAEIRLRQILFHQY